MGRPRVDKILPAYASKFEDRHKRERVRFRRTGWPTVYARHRPGSIEFTQEYIGWVDAGREPVASAKIIPGTFDDLIVRFYKSRKWREIADSTREQYRGQLERFRAKHGHRPVKTAQTRHFEKIFDEMDGTPSAANNLRKRLKQLMNFAIKLGIREDNPIMATESLKTPAGGYPDWSQNEIKQFENRHPVGTRARLAFDLALFTAQRKADVCTMGPSDIVDGKIKLIQRKTGKELLLPIHPILAASLVGVDAEGAAFIMNDWGKPYTVDSFGIWFKRRCVEAGIHDRSMHGLRKTAARRLAEAGLSNQMIKSVTGHTSDTEVAHYTAAADQAKMANHAIASLDLANLTA